MEDPWWLSSKAHSSKFFNWDFTEVKYENEVSFTELIKSRIKGTKEVSSLFSADALSP
jgi:hypothetical protein